ncbi:hypothetical protein VPH35_088904 [Triticum aestivum]
MSVELVLWLFSFASVMALVGLTAYQLICLSDLEFDYINPYDSSSRINAVVIIEYALQGVLCASFLLTLNWFPFLVMAPVTYYHVKLYVLLPLSPVVYPQTINACLVISLLYCYYLFGLLYISD